MKTTIKSGLQWYDVAWRLGTTAHQPKVDSSVSHEISNSSNTSEIDWYVKGWHLGTQADLNAKSKDRWTIDGVKSEIAHLWGAIASFLSVSYEPHLWKTTDSTGQVTWNAYDPKTGRSAQYLSEHEMRVWLEERYYQ